MCAGYEGARDGESVQRLGEVYESGSKPGGEGQGKRGDVRRDH